MRKSSFNAPATLPRFVRSALSCSVWLVLPFAAGCSAEARPAKVLADEDQIKSWQERTYLLSIPRTNWSEPPQIGNEIGDFVPQFLFGTGAPEGKAVAVTMGTADASGAQNMCNPTSQFEAVVEGYPSVTIGPSEFQVHIVHPRQPVEVDATILGLTMTNILPDNGVPAEEGELTATMDFRELYPLFTQLPEPSAQGVCAALESTYMTGCEPCPDGLAFCLSLRAVRLGASEMSGGTLEPVDPAALDPSCVQ